MVGPYQRENLQRIQNNILDNLQKDLEVELAVKKGLENFMKIDQSNDRCRELLEVGMQNAEEEAEWIAISRFQTCKIKISMLEMEIGKIRHDMQASIDSSKFIGIEWRSIREEWLIAAGDTRSKTEILIDELLFRYRKELALKDGAMNMTKTLKAQKKTDQKCVNDVCWFVQLFSVHEWTNYRQRRHTFNLPRRLISSEWLCLSTGPSICLSRGISSSLFQFQQWIGDGQSALQGVDGRNRGVSDASRLFPLSSAPSGTILPSVLFSFHSTQCKKKICHIQRTNTHIE